MSPKSVVSPPVTDIFWLFQGSKFQLFFRNIPVPSSVDVPGIFQVKGFLFLHLSNLDETSRNGGHNSLFQGFCLLTWTNSSTGAFQKTCFFHQNWSFPKEVWCFFHFSKKTYNFFFHLFSVCFFCFSPPLVGPPGWWPSSVQSHDCPGSPAPRLAAWGQKWCVDLGNFGEKLETSGDFWRLLEIWCSFDTTSCECCKFVAWRHGYRNLFFGPCRNFWCQCWNQGLLRPSHKKRRAWWFPACLTRLKWLVAAENQYGHLSSWGNLRFYTT